MPHERDDLTEYNWAVSPHCRSDARRRVVSSRSGVMTRAHSASSPPASACRVCQPRGRPPEMAKDARPVSVPSTSRGSSQSSRCSASTRLPSSVTAHTLTGVPCGTWTATWISRPSLETTDGGRRHRHGACSASRRALWRSSTVPVRSPNAANTPCSVPAATGCSLPSQPRKEVLTPRAAASLRAVRRPSLWVSCPVPSAMALTLLGRRASARTSPPPILSCRAPGLVMPVSPRGARALHPQFVQP